MAGRNWKRRQGACIAKRGLTSLGSLLCGVSLLTWSPPGAASGPLGANGEDVSTSQYAVDLHQTAIWSGSRLTSLAGAYVAVAFDVDGMLQNPAAPAVRPDFSVSEFDYWLGLGATFPSSLEDKDFFNSGDTTALAGDPEGLLYLTPAIILQFGALGVGLNIEYQAYGMGSIEVDGSSTSASNQFVQTHLQVAYAFGDGAYVFGGGVRLLSNEVSVGSSLNSNREVPLSATGAGVELGGLWKPFGQYFQVGAAFRSAITARASFSDSTIVTEGGDYVIPTNRGDFYLPERVELPWDVNVGILYRLGNAPRNTAWQSDYDVAEKEIIGLRYRYLALVEERDAEISGCASPEKCALLDEHYRLALEDIEYAIERAQKEGYWKLQQKLAEQPQRQAFVSASFVITGAVDDAVGIESFVVQRVNRSGQSPTYSPRVGSEVDVVPGWLRARSGAYLEPTRFETGSLRPHYTGGIDVPIGVWNVFGLWPDDYRWRLAGSFDIARRFTTWSIGIGGWYPRHRETVKRPAREPEPLEILSGTAQPWPIVKPGRVE